MAPLLGVSRRPASLPRVQESSGSVSRVAGAEVTVRVQESDPVTRRCCYSQVNSQRTHLNRKIAELAEGHVFHVPPRQGALPAIRRCIILPHEGGCSVLHRLSPESSTRLLDCITQSSWYWL
jgi:hypothetical protein